MNAPFDPRTQPSTIALGAIASCTALADEWERLHGRREWPDELSNAACSWQTAIEDALGEMPAVTMVDIVAKARIVSVMEREGTVRCGRHTTIAASLLRDLERLAGGAA
jgi:hypothetical protein